MWPVRSRHLLADALVHKVSTFRLEWITVFNSGFYRAYKSTLLQMYHFNNRSLRLAELSIIGHLLIVHLCRFGLYYVSSYLRRTIMSAHTYYSLALIAHVWKPCASEPTHSNFKTLALDVKNYSPSQILQSSRHRAGKERLNICSLSVRPSEASV